MSSSQTLSTVPASPLVRITALPISSVWACSNSPRIVDARTFAGGMGDPVSEFERVGLHLKGAQVMTGARQTGVKPARNFGDRKAHARGCTRMM